jgi:hypothetical protein
MGKDIHDPESGLPRISIPRTPVNKTPVILGTRVDLGETRS